MEKIDQIIAFLKDLQGSCATQISWLNHLTTLQSAIDSGDNMYFCAGLHSRQWSWTNGRCKDDDIKMKKYFVIDIDIRSDTKKEKGVVLTDEELNQEIENIISTIDKSDKFRSYSYVVHSGNWLHIYYVWNEYVFDKEIYKRWVETIYTMFSDETGFKCDYATANIGWLIRLPWTTNIGRKKKYDLEPIEARFLRIQPQNSNLLDIVEILGKKFLQDIEEKRQRQQKESEAKRKSLEITGWWKTFDMINSIDIWVLFCNETGCKMHENWKDIKSPKDWKNIWAFIYDNILYYKWTRYLSWNIAWYNTFSYIKYEILNTQKDEDVFEYCREERSDIKEADNNARREYMRNKEEKEKKKVSDLPKIQMTETKKDPKTFDEMGLIRFSTGVPKINDIVWHFRSNELVLLHWASKNGKTMLTMSIANDNWSYWIKTAFFSLEMDVEKLKTQQSCIRSWIDRSDFENAKYTQNQREKYCDVYKNFDRFFTIFDESVLTETLSSEYICSQIEKLHKEDWYELFIIDSLQLMIWDNISDQNRLQAKCIKDLKRLKNKLPICIVLIHHNNKWWETFSGAQELENFSDWRITIKKELDPDANGVSIFHKTIITIFKERLWKELEFEFNFDRWNLVYTGHWYAWKTK